MKDCPTPNPFRFSTCVINSARLAFMAALTLTGSGLSIQAATVIDDHFSGNSGGTPANWSSLGGGTVVESTTTVTFTDTTSFGTGILSSSSYNPQSTTTTMVADLTGFSGTGEQQAFVSMVSDTFNYFHAVIRNTGAVHAYSDLGGGFVDHSLGTITGYSGGAVQMTVTMDGDSFSIQTDVGSFDTGDTLYSNTTLGFSSLAGMGTSVSPALIALGGDSKATFDRIVVSTEPIPEPSSLALITIGLFLGTTRRQR